MGRPVFVVLSAVLLWACGSPEVRGVTAGGTRSCVWDSDGQAKCWGGRALTAVTSEADLTPKPVPSLEKATQLCTGDFHACARLSGGKVACWGMGDAAAAKDVSGLQDVAELACGDAGGCARGSSGDLRCWAWTADGPGSIEPVAGVSAVSGGVAVGGGHFCAVKDDQSVWCWGDNSDGQLGVSPGSVRSSAEPIQVQGLQGVVSVSAGAQHSCALGSDGKVRCWGSNEAGQLGYSGGSSLAPVEVAGLDGVKQVTSGAGHSCALSGDGSVRCWGRNLYGQLGDQTTLDRNAPVEASGLPEVQRVAAGRDHTCALGSDGSVWCWGRNFLGQVGNGTRDDQNAPVAVTF